MGITLLEAAKQVLAGGEIFRAGVIETFAAQSDLLRVLPFNSIAGNAYRYNQEQTLPGIGFRGVNGTYTASTGILNPVVEPLVIAGGEVEVDNFITATMGEGIITTQRAMKIKALAHNWTLKFLKGDSETSSKEFDGLQKRCVGDQLVSAGTTNTGDALSLAKLDELIDGVYNPTHLIMNKAMRRRLSTAARTTSVGGNLTWSKDEFGGQVALYNDLPIVIADADNTGAQILAFDEAPATAGGTSVSTSIYCVSLMDEGVSGIQNGTMQAKDFGEVEAKPCSMVRVEWYCGMMILHPKGASRLYGITNAAVVA
jgi:hypothetical protein